MQFVFFNESGTLRSGWRAGVFLIAFLIATIALGAVAQVSLTSFQIAASQSSSAVFLANALASLIPAIVIGWLCGKYLEELPFAALGANFVGRWFSHLLAGLALGTAALGFAVLIAVVFAGLKFAMSETGENALASLALGFLVFGVAAAFEEALFRGYIFQTLARSGLAWLAILLTAVFFGTVHLGNPSSSVVSTLNTILAGVWLGIAYLKTRDLWFVWGIHLAWNWVQGSVFGIEVSGLRNLGGPSLMTEIDAGPTWLTGANYGIEGGIACTIAIVLAIVLVYFLPIRPVGEGRTNSR